jgi:hypothetical protein
MKMVLYVIRLNTGIGRKKVNMNKRKLSKIARVNGITGDVELERIKHTLAKKHLCYVLITCSRPSHEGQMEVEMNFEGDVDLASLMVDNASQVFHDKRAHRESL